LRFITAEQRIEELEHALDRWLAVIDRLEAENADLRRSLDLARPPCEWEAEARAVGVLPIADTFKT
jgi:hypothetical protein